VIRIRSVSCRNSGKSNAPAGSHSA
jgi:hypothetical protein